MKSAITFWNETTNEAMDMLSLTRKEGQSLHVGDDVVITIKRVEGKKVKVSIEAPCSVKIIRSELVDFTLFDEISNYKD